MAAEEGNLETQKLTDFLGVVEGWRDTWNVGERAVYRGHKDFNWILMAKLFRDPHVQPENRRGDNPSEVEKQLLTEHLPKSEAHSLEHRLFHDFSRYLYAYRPDLICTVSEDEKSNTRAIAGMETVIYRPTLWATDPLPRFYYERARRIVLCSGRTCDAAENNTGSI